MSKPNKSIIFVFAVIIVLSAIYRMVPYTIRPEWLGAPQLAIAIFAGSVIKNKKWAFALPLFSMLASDLLMQALHSVNPATYYPGFYKGQLLNYILIIGITTIGFLVNSRKWLQILSAAIAAPILFFLLSNLVVWIGGGGFGHPKTLSGLMLTYTDGLPFLRTSLLGTVVFSGLLFGVYQLFQRPASQTQTAFTQRW